MNSSRNDPRMPVALTINNGGPGSMAAREYQFYHSRWSDPEDDSMMRVKYQTNAKNMIELDLSGRHLMDIPVEVYQFARVESLLLVRNQLQHVCHRIGVLQRLKELRVDRNEIRRLPDSLCNCSHLKLLSASHNQLNALPSTLGRLHHLTELSIADNRFTELPHCLGQMKHLRKLDLSGNQLGSLPFTLKNLSHMRELLMNYNHFESIPHVVFYMEKLERLEMRRNRVYQVPQELVQLKRLAHLTLASNALQVFPVCVLEMRSLRTLSLANNNLKYVPFTLSKLNKLEVLNMRGNQIPSFSTDACVSLKKLNLAQNQLKFITVENLRQLTHLNVANNQLETIPLGLFSCLNLQEIHMQNNLLSLLPPDIKLLTSLRYLNVKENQITHISHTITSLNQLEYLNVDGNPLLEGADHLPPSGERLDCDSVKLYANGGTDGPQPPQDKASATNAGGGTLTRIFGRKRNEPVKAKRLNDSASKAVPVHAMDGQSFLFQHKGSRNNKRTDAGYVSAAESAPGNLLPPGRPVMSSSDFSALSSSSRSVSSSSSSSSVSSSTAVNEFSPTDEPDEVKDWSPWGNNMIGRGTGRHHGDITAHENGGKRRLFQLQMWSNGSGEGPLRRRSNSSDGRPTRKAQYKKRNGQNGHFGSRSVSHATGHRDLLPPEERPSSALVRLRSVTPGPEYYSNHMHDMGPPLRTSPRRPLKHSSSASRSKSNGTMAQRTPLEMAVSRSYLSSGPSVRKSDTFHVGPAGGTFVSTDDPNITLTFPPKCVVHNVTLLMQAEAIDAAKVEQVRSHFDGFKDILSVGHLVHVTCLQPVVFYKPIAMTVPAPPPYGDGKHKGHLHVIDYSPEGSCQSTASGFSLQGSYVHLQAWNVSSPVFCRGAILSKSRSLQMTSQLVEAIMRHLRG